MTKALVSMFSGDAELVRDVTWPPMRRYAERYGYELREAEPITEPGLAVTWSKVPPLIGALEVGHEYALWLDADCLIMDGAWDIADELPADCFQALAYDNRWNMYSAIWLVHADGLWFLRELWARRHEAPHSEDVRNMELQHADEDLDVSTLRLQAGWGDPEGTCRAPLIVHRGVDTGTKRWRQRALVLAHEAQRGPRAENAIAFRGGGGGG